MPTVVGGSITQRVGEWWVGDSLTPPQVSQGLSRSSRQPAHSQQAGQFAAHSGACVASSQRAQPRGEKGEGWDPGPVGSQLSPHTYSACPLRCSFLAWPPPPAACFALRLLVPQLGSGQGQSTGNAWDCQSVTQEMGTEGQEEEERVSLLEGGRGVAQGAGQSAGNVSSTHLLPPAEALKSAPPAKHGGQSRQPLDNHGYQRWNGLENI